MKGKIAEIFESVQGEGIYFGEKQLFIRFFGCNLNCQYCDTKLKYFLEYEPQELFRELTRYQDNYHSISFTGGEPLLQKDFLKEVLKFTAHRGYKNYLETNGTLYQELKEVIDHVDIIAMDVKLPSSTATGDFWKAHRDFLDIASKKEVFLKSVVCASTTADDLEQACKLIKAVNHSVILVLQPDSRLKEGEITEKLQEFRALVEKNKITACIIPQMHNIIGIK